MFKTILLAYNGTKEGKSALLDCAEIAAFGVTQMHLLAVASMPSGMFLGDGYMTEELLDAERKHGQAVLDEGVAHLKQLGFGAAGHLAVGEPVEEICRLAAEIKADLIIIGHNQHAAFAARWWRGSVGRALLDHAPCSIYIARTRD